MLESSFLDQLQEIDGFTPYIVRPSMTHRFAMNEDIRRAFFCSRDAFQIKKEPRNLAGEVLLISCNVIRAAVYSNQVPQAVERAYYLFPDWSWGTVTVTDVSVTFPARSAAL